MAPSIIEVVAPYAAFEPSDAGAGALLDEIHAIIEAEYAVHPFSKTSITKDNAATVLRQYIAMSQAFPYLQVSAVPCILGLEVGYLLTLSIVGMQAGVGKDFIFKSMENNTDMPKDIERTFVVGMFICWFVPPSRSFALFPNFLFPSVNSQGRMWRQLPPPERRHAIPA
jgi:hypothetical protein